MGVTGSEQHVLADGVFALLIVLGLVFGSLRFIWVVVQRDNVP